MPASRGQEHIIWHSVHQRFTLRLRAAVDAEVALRVDILENRLAAVEKVLARKRDKTNVNGGAIALGHPLGASGTRLVITILNELRRNGLRYGLATACIGGGQGIAMIVEALRN